MQISDRFVGTTLKPFQTRADARDTMNYAAAINDNNPRYFDDQRPGGLGAHPLHPVAITWQITAKIWEFIEANDFPLDVLLTMVHHTEVITYHRPLVPGMDLTIKGAIAAIEPHRAGTRVVLRYTAVSNGQPVFTEYCGALLRGVTCAGDGRGVETLPALPEPANASGPTWTATIDIDPLRPYIYDGCANIFFPIHTSPKFAGDVGLPGIILQGTASLAFCLREIVNREADQNPARIKTLGGRFSGMIRPGTRIEINLLGRQQTPEGQAVFFEVRNNEGRKALTDGYVLIERNSK